MYRGHLSRRLLIIYSVAAIRLQRFYNAIQAKRLWASKHLDVPTIVRAEKLWRLDLASSSTGSTITPTSYTSYNQINALLATFGDKPTDKDGNTALMLACRAGSVRLVKACLSAGYGTTTINSSDKQTALHLAAASGGGRFTIGQLLIEAGADITATDSLGRSVCHVAAASGDFKLLKLLCDTGAPLEVTDRVSGKRNLLTIPVEGGNFCSKIIATKM